METRPTAEHERIAFGEFLRQARERRRLTLEQIAGETKIAPRLLTSLEQGNVQPMPKGMYRRAMLRAYAESVGLDTDAALTEFERTFEEPPPRQASLPPVQHPAPAPARPRAAMSRRGVTVAVVAAILTAAFGLAIWAFRPGSASSPAPAPTVTSAAAPAAARAAAPAAVVQPPAGPAAPSGATATSGTHDVARPAAQERREEVRVAPAPAAPLATEGRLVVTSDPAGARVTVNGVGWGQTPVTINYLPLGEKRIRVTMAGYISEERTVRLDGRRANATVRVALRERP
jgi:cytoskeleton protein RodZ